MASRPKKPKMVQNHVTIDAGQWVPGADGDDDAEQAQAQDFGFTLTGVVADQRGKPVPGKTFEESFTCLPVMPSGSLLDLVIGIGYDNLHTQTLATLQFITGTLVPGDEDRFHALIRDKTRIVPTEALVALASALSDHFIGRPT